MTRKIKTKKRTITRPSISRAKSRVLSKTSQSMSLSRRLKKKCKALVKKTSTLTKLFFIVGLILIIIPTFFYINEGIQLAFFTPKIVPVAPKQFAIPTFISIPAVNMKLPIFETAITHGIWEVADGGISHLNVSARPGENGPIILYGHNTNNRFGPIRWLSKGEEITITTSKNVPRTYTIIRTVDVSPNEVSILLFQKGETLILYTCDGFADLQRFIVIAKPV